jgi:hypothetical protein
MRSLGGYIVGGDKRILALGNRWKNISRPNSISGLLVTVADILALSFRAYDHTYCHPDDDNPRQIFSLYIPRYRSGASDLCAYSGS